MRRRKREKRGEGEVNGFTDMDRMEWWLEPNLAYDRSVPREFEAIAIGWIEDDSHLRGGLESGDLARSLIAYS